MLPTEQSADPTLCVLEQFFGAATNHAAKALSQWTNGRARLSVDSLRQVPLELVTDELGIGDDLLSIVVLGIEGEMGGQIILCLDDVTGRRLAAILLGKPSTTEGEWSELEVSAAMETGNILGSAYLNEMSKLTGKMLIPSPPAFLQDFAGCVIEQAVMMQAMEREQVLIGQTRFVMDDEELNWNVLVVPAPELLDAIADLAGGQE